MRWRPSLLLAGVVFAGCTSSPPDEPDRRETTPPAPRHDVPIAIVSHLGAEIDNLTAVQAKVALDTGVAPASLEVVTAEVAEAGEDVRTMPTVERNGIRMGSSRPTPARTDRHSTSFRP